MVSNKLRNNKNNNETSLDIVLIATNIVRFETINAVKKSLMTARPCLL